MSRILIIGAGLAGATAAIALRQGGFEGAIIVAGAETDLPYERPPLSKDYLSGDRPLERLWLRPPAFWAERGIAIETGCRIVALDPAARTAATGNGRLLPWDLLVWAAGGQARRVTVPGGEHAHLIRTREDADRLRDALVEGARAVIIGGGYIGLEAAAVLRTLGHPVTLLEAQDRLLARVTGPEISAFMKAEHEARGVIVRLGETVAAIEGGNRVEAVRLASGERIPAEVVIAGIGLVPEVGPLAAAGADCPDGVRVDSHGRTGLPGIYAAGDCALHPNAFAGGGLVRLESVQNAADMAKAVAAHILEGDKAAPYRAVPWFWSNQYDLKLQTVGLPLGADRRILRGDPSSRSWSLVYLRAGAVIALDCINAVRDYMGGRALVERGAMVDPDRLSDPTVPLKSL